MKILVTGATGFVGKHLTKRLIQDRHEVAITTRSPELAEKYFGKLVNIINVSPTILDAKRFIHSFDPKVCIHLASFLTSEEGGETTKRLVETNIGFTTYLCDSLSDTQLSYFINTGSFSEYYKGNGTLDPAYLYSATKTAARYLIEYYAKTYDFKLINIVPYTIYGEGNTSKKVIDYIVQSILNEEKVAMTRGLQTLDFIHIRDVIEFYTTLIKNIETGSLYPNEYHLGTGVGTTLRELAEIVRSMAGKDTIPIEWGKRPYRKRDVMYAVAPKTNQFKKLNWKPNISLKEGLKKLISEFD